MRTLEGRPKWQLRAMLVVYKRLFLIIFALVVWTAARIMAEVTPFPSRRFILELVGTISVAYLVVGFAARLVRNPLMRKIVSWGSGSRSRFITWAYWTRRPSFWTVWASAWAI